MKTYTEIKLTGRREGCIRAENGQGDYIVTRKGETVAAAVKRAGWQPMATTIAMPGSALLAR